MPTYLDAQHGVSLSEAYAEAAASAPAERLMHYTYELSHPLFDERICIVNDFENLTATLEGGDTVDFIACPVDVVGPDESDAGKSPTISVKIDGVSSIVVGQLDSGDGALGGYLAAHALHGGHQNGLRPLFGVFGGVFLQLIDEANQVVLDIALGHLHQLVGGVFFL